MIITLADGINVVEGWLICVGIVVLIYVSILEYRTRKARRRSGVGDSETRKP